MSESDTVRNERNVIAITNFFTNIKHHILTILELLQFKIKLHDLTTVLTHFDTLKD